MSQFLRVVQRIALAACALAGCSQKTTQGSGPPLERMTQLTCASQTYRVAADKIDAAVNDACEHAKQSAQALKDYRATVTRFTCQESDGHVVLSLLAPRDLFDEYGKNCQQYLAVQEAFRNRSIDIHAHHDASQEFTAKNNELARKHGEDDNALFRQRASDQATVGRLIKERGGSIEIPN
jgi:hypothetical protein